MKTLSIDIETFSPEPLTNWGFEKYGKTWIAYRRPPEGES